MRVNGIKILTTATDRSDQFGVGGDNYRVRKREGLREIPEELQHVKGHERD